MHAHLTDSPLAPDRLTGPVSVSHFSSSRVVVRSADVASGEADQQEKSLIEEVVVVKNGIHSKPKNTSSHLTQLLAPPVTRVAHHSLDPQFVSIMSVTLHTDVGDLKIELFCDQAPNTCTNFLALCASDYYDGCLFHRNIKGFMVQTGDPTNTGKGGQSIWNRKFEDELSDELKHSVRGVVSMANSGPSTNASQFFITYGKQPHLDMKYTVFGKVIDGFDTLDALEKIPVVNTKAYRPQVDTKIKRVTIHANPLAG